MRRREFITLIRKMAAAAPFAAVAQRVTRAASAQAKAHRVGVILQGGPWYVIIDALRNGLRQLGEQKQLVLDIHDTRGDLNAVEDAARTLEKEKVDLICTIATSVSLAAKRATDNVPIVFVAGTDPVAVKLVETIPRPGGRLTGVHFLSTELMGKRLELLREMAPNTRRVITFYNPVNRSAIESAREGREAARHLGLEFMERHVASVEELQKAVQAFLVGEADAYVAVSDAMIDSHADLIIAMAKRNRLPTMFYQQDLITKGGLVSYSTDFNEIGRVTARYVQRILSGTKPADLPVERVDRLYFVINLNTAKEIGLAIPESILIRADRVIE
jgi:putative ABC transport system substrate-binding protein